jgi:hypothetical protein
MKRLGHSKGPRLRILGPDRFRCGKWVDRQADVPNLATVRLESLTYVGVSAIALRGYL